jgi:hypothetical protein
VREEIVDEAQKAIRKQIFKIKKTIFLVRYWELNPGT